MAFLTVAGTDLEVQTTGAARNEDERIGGTRRRSFAGVIRSQVKAHKRRWAFTTSPLTLAAADAFRALVDFDAHVACTGDALGGASVTCVVDIGESPYLQDGESFMVSLALTLTEV